MATAPALAWWVEELGGDAVELDRRVAFDVDHHAWQPSVEDAIALSSADWIVLQGAGWEGWRETVALPESRVLDTTEGLELIALSGRTHSHGAGGEHSHHEPDPHTWYDPSRLSQQGAAIAAGLGRLLPARATEIDVRYQARATELAELAARLEVVGAKSRERPVVWLLGSPELRYLAGALGVEARLVVDARGGLDEHAAGHVRRAEAKILLATGPTPAILERWPDAEVILTPALSGSGAAEPLAALRTLAAALERRFDELGAGAAS
jgi:zinc transport system substrate-binding protein